MSEASDFIVSSLGATILPDLDGYRYRNKGHSGSVYTNEDGIAVKVYRSDLPVDAVHYEYSVLKALQKTSLQTLKLIDAVRVGDQWGFRYHWIEGDPYYTHMRENADNVELTGRRFADLHHEIHQIPKFDILPSQGENLGFILKKSAAISDEDKREILIDLEGMPEQPVLCHGDFNPANTLACPKRAYVIDWQRAYWGDPLADVAKTWIKLSFHAFCTGKASDVEKTRLAAFLEVYRDRYQELSSFEASQFQAWCKITAAVLSRSPEADKRGWYLRLVDKSRKDPEGFGAFVLGQTNGI